MSINFPLILLCLTVFSGVVTFVDYILRGRKKPEKHGKDLPLLVDYARSLFPVFLIVLLLRSFVAQPFRVPSGSLEPTIIPGDFILVNQYDYGLHLPVWHKTILPISHPKRGQIALFFWPVDPHITFVKRVIGVPGDTISYINKVFYINGQEMKQTYLGESTIREGRLQIKMAKYEENLDGVKHDIYVCAKDATNCPTQSHDFYNLKIPKGRYLMIGDNRDDSDDSRDWGFVPEKNFIGRALFIWMSWDANAPLSKKIRWNRIGDTFH